MIACPKTPTWWCCHQVPSSPQRVFWMTVRFCEQISTVISKLMLCIPGADGSCGFNDMSDARDYIVDTSTLESLEQTTSRSVPLPESDLTANATRSLSAPEHPEEDISYHVAGGL